MIFFYLIPKDAKFITHRWLRFGFKLQQQHNYKNKEIKNPTGKWILQLIIINTKKPMTFKAYSSARRIRTLLPIALMSVFFLGTSRLVFDNLKNRPNGFLPWKLTWLQGGTRGGVGGVGGDLDDDVIDIEDCNVFQGKWVMDNASRPLYTEQSCPYLVKQVACQRNGRPDNLYQSWRWQPHDCNLPRFNGVRLLESLRNKRLMFVGDSIQRGQFDSMVCLLQSVIPEGKKLLYKVPSKKIFYAERRLVRLDSVANHSRHWDGVDFLVFESYVWWMYKPVINATNGSPDDVSEYNVTNAYRMALQTWAKWLESSIDPEKQRVFFMSLSPTHLWRWEWNHGSEGNCFNETQPIEGPFWGAGTSIDIMNIVKDTLQDLKTEVTLLNITQLSDYRKDAHTSVYTERKGKLLTKEERADPDHNADCIHWCLPGVPDTWNEILYAHILQYS
ncbi:hypothetical protein V2J09_018945 [Rumex salicifolius]